MISFLPFETVRRGWVERARFWQQHLRPVLPPKMYHSVMALLTHWYIHCLRRRKVTTAWLVFPVALSGLFRPGGIPQDRCAVEPLKPPGRRQIPGLVICRKLCYCVYGAPLGRWALHKTAGSHATPKGGDKMPITLTFHVLFWTVTIRVKSRNRHPGR